MFQQTQSDFEKQNDINELVNLMNNTSLKQEPQSNTIYIPGSREMFCK